MPLLEIELVITLLFKTNGMANTLDPMDLKQILSLHLDGLSNRKIGASLGISRNTVNVYLRLFKASDYGLDKLLEFDNLKLERLFPSHTTIDNERYNTLVSYFDILRGKLHQPGFTFSYHYQCYCNEVSNPYSYTQFLEHYHRKFPKEKGSMKLEHVAGEAMFVDYAGKKLHVLNKETGELEAVEVFVAILPSSQYTYVEACESQKQEDFIRCCENALRFYGGAPKLIVSDNLKSGVGKSYIAQALGHQACIMQHKTLYQNTARMFKKLKLCKADGTYLKELNKILKTELLILDDFGLQSFDNHAREALMDIVDDRHGKSSTIIASQIPVSAWYDIIGESTIADAILDRIVNSSHRIKLDGESLRKAILNNQ